MIISPKLLQEAEQFTKDLTSKNKDRFNLTSRGEIQPGDLVQFEYRAKHAGTLLFWDAKPAVIVLKKSGSRMLGLNLHFVPFALRKLIAEFVINKNRSNIASNKRMFLDYRMIKAFLEAIKATICIRSYIVGNMSSKVVMVKNTKDYILGATLLKTQLIYKLTSDQIYKIALGQQYSTQKKVGQRRTDREKKKIIKKKHF